MRASGPSLRPWRALATVEPVAAGRRRERAGPAAGADQTCHDRRVSTESRHLSVYIERSVDDVDAFVSDPANLPRWARGLGGDVVRTDEGWFVETPDGRARVEFAAQNPFGVLDHEVRTPLGQTVHVPLRALADGDGCEVVFTLRRAPGMSDDELERDAAQVTGDLAQLKQVLEHG